MSCDPDAGSAKGAGAAGALSQPAASAPKISAQIVD
jgi:hypothetical protein